MQNMLEVGERCAAGAGAGSGGKNRATGGFTSCNQWRPQPFGGLICTDAICFEGFCRNAKKNAAKKGRRLVLCKRTVSVRLQARETKRPSLVSTFTFTPASR